MGENGIPESYEEAGLVSSQNVWQEIDQACLATDDPSDHEALAQLHQSIKYGEPISRQEEAEIRAKIAEITAKKVRLCVPPEDEAA